MLFARPHNSDASVKTNTDPIKIRRCPYRVLNFALNGSISTNPKEYAVNVQPSQLKEVFKSFCNAGRAVATIVESIVIISSVNATTMNIRNRLTFGLFLFKWDIFRKRLELKF